MVADSVTWLLAQFARPWALVFVLFLPSLALLRLVAVKRRRRAVLEFIGFQSHLLDSRQPGRWRRFISFVSLTCIVVGIAGPRWGHEAEMLASTGREIMVVLDVSRSMLAEDPPKSRLARAKQYLSEFSRNLEAAGGGHRLGLIAFAGQARLLCPPTSDYDHFRYALAEAHPDRLGPGLRLGKADVGTRLGNAVELAVACLTREAAGFQDILLVSDYDDLDSVDKGVSAAESAGVAVHCLAVGDGEKPARIPHESGYLQFQGEYVLTRRRDDVARRISEATAGQFVPEEPNSRALPAWFGQAIAPLPKQQWDESRRLVESEQYVPFYLVALTCMTLSLVMGKRRSGGYDERDEGKEDKD